MDGKPPVFYVSLNFLFGDRGVDGAPLVREHRAQMAAAGLRFAVRLDRIRRGSARSLREALRVRLRFCSPLSWPGPATEAEDEAQGRVQQFRFGLSMNINKALDWVKLSTWPLLRAEEITWPSSGDSDYGPILARRKSSGASSSSSTRPQPRRHRAAGSARTRQ